MRTQWTAKENRDAVSSCSCDRGLQRYLRNFGGGGVWKPQTPPLGTPLPTMMIRCRSTAAYALHHTLSWTFRSYIQLVVTHSASRACLYLLWLAHELCCWRDYSDQAVGSADDAVYGAGTDSFPVAPVTHRRMHYLVCLNRGLACFLCRIIYGFVWCGVCKQSRWRQSVTEPSEDSGYVLIWQRYDNNKMVAMRYYGNVMTTMSQYSGDVSSVTLSLRVLLLLKMCILSLL